MPVTGLLSTLCVTQCMVQELSPHNHTDAMSHRKRKHRGPTCLPRFPGLPMGPLCPGTPDCPLGPISPLAVAEGRKQEVSTWLYLPCTRQQMHIAFIHMIPLDNAGTISFVEIQNCNKIF